jgi:plasmid stabilization system protein ParE
MKRLSYSELALDDLRGILDYIASDNPSAATGFVDALIERCHLVAQNPEIGVQREDVAIDLRLFTYHGYGIYYRTLDAEVRIERVLHPALDVGSQTFVQP